MSSVTYEAYVKMTVIPDRESVPFVAKIQKARTRKNKDYFVLRTTLPKEVAEKIGVEAGDFLFFKAKKAQWYHMLDWKAMENTWGLLPDDFKNRVMMDGLHGQPILSLPNSSGTASVATPLVQMLNMQREQAGELQWK